MKREPALHPPPEPPEDPGVGVAVAVGVVEIVGVTVTVGVVVRVGVSEGPATIVTMSSRDPWASLVPLRAVTRTVYCPAVPKACVMLFVGDDVLMTVSGVPSPKSHVYEPRVHPTAVAVALKVTGSPAAPWAGLAVSEVTLTCVVGPQRKAGREKKMAKRVKQRTIASCLLRCKKNPPYGRLPKRRRTLS